MKETMQITTLRLAESELARIRALARELDRSYAWVTRRLLRIALELVQDDPKRL